jgi:hypothetical protein
MGQEPTLYDYAIIFAPFLLFPAMPSHASRLFLAGLICQSGIVMAWQDWAFTADSYAAVIEMHWINFPWGVGALVTIGAVVAALYYTQRLNFSRDLMIKIIARLAYKCVERDNASQSTTQDNPLLLTHDVSTKGDDK